MQVESAVRPLLDAYFSPLSGVQVLAQPGNFYVASAFSLAVNVIGKKMVTRHWDNLVQGEQLNSLCHPVKSDCTSFVSAPWKWIWADGCPRKDWMVCVRVCCVKIFYTWVLHNLWQKRVPLKVPSLWITQHVLNFWHGHRLYLHRWEQWRYWVPVLHEWRCLWPIQLQAAGKLHRCPISAQGQ